MRSLAGRYRLFSSSASATSTSEEIISLKQLVIKHGQQLEKQQDMLTQIMIKLTTTKEEESKKLSSATSSSSSSVIPKTKNPRGFLEYSRKPEPYRPPKERARDWLEINVTNPDGNELKKQVSRCMDCGTPFCQTHTGCPINNLIPEWNELVLTDKWKEAIERLHATNNFPEFTGRVCPAPCEGACVAGVNTPSDAVTIKNSEYAIVDRAFKEGWIKPRSIPKRTGKKVAVIGSGPAGLAAADMLNLSGHSVTVFERSDRIGGLLMYGIPHMKLAKETVDRRVNLLKQEGIEFVTNAEIKTKQDLLPTNYDAILLAVGAGKPRDFDPAVTPGRNLQGIHFAMDFLTKNQKDLSPDSNGVLQNRWGDVISTKGKRVVVIGGGDTGTDCIGTSVRQFCKSIVNLEILPKPPVERNNEKNPWPQWPRIFRTDYGHGEAKEIFGVDPRQFAVGTKKFLPDFATKTKLRAIQIVSLDEGLREIPNSEREIPADVCLLAMGFLGVEDRYFNVALDGRRNVETNQDMLTNQPGVFAAGDCRRGQSLVVWAIREGRDVAKKINDYLLRI